MRQKRRLLHQHVHRHDLQWGLECYHTIFYVVHGGNANPDNYYRATFYTGRAYNTYYCNDSAATDVRRCG